MIKQGDSITNARTGQRMIFLQTWAETNGIQLQIECFSPVTSLKEPEHLHPFQENRFRIMGGELSFRINGKEQTAHAGDTVSIPKNVAHHFWNSGNSEAHYIQEFYPALRIDSLFETFFALARDGKLNQKAVFTLLSPVSKLLGYSREYK